MSKVDDNRSPSFSHSLTVSSYPSVSEFSKLLKFEQDISLDSDSIKPLELIVEEHFADFICQLQLISELIHP